MPNNFTIFVIYGVPAEVVAHLAPPVYHRIQEFVEKLDHFQMEFDLPLSDHGELH